MVEIGRRRLLKSSFCFFLFFFFNDTATTEIYTLSLHDALPIFSLHRGTPPGACCGPDAAAGRRRDRKSTRLNSSHTVISYAVFCLKKKNLKAALSISPGEEKAGEAKRATVLADALEAALGALYLDGGLEVAREFVRRAWNDAMIEQAEPPKDPKTALQEWAQKRGKDLPIYEVTGRSGPPHAPAFTVTVTVGSADATGIAGNKRAAEQLAAEALLTRLPA